MSGIRDAIALARRNLDTDANLAVFVVRDYQEVKDAGLSSMAWTLYRAGYTPRSEAAWLLDELEKWLETHEPVAAPQPAGEKG